MVVVTPVLLDKSVRLADFDSDYRIDVVTAAFLKVECTKVGSKDVYSHREDTDFLAILRGARAATCSIFGWN
jgi:hypothetical protein